MVPITSCVSTEIHAECCIGPKLPSHIGYKQQRQSMDIGYKNSTRTRPNTTLKAWQAQGVYDTNIVKYWYAASWYKTIYACLCLGVPIL